MLKKRYIKSRQTCKVTFEVPQAELPVCLPVGVDAASVHLVGDFNEWNRTATPMVRARGGAYRVTLELDPGKTYPFRYLVNGEHWCNDWHADGYVPSGFGTDNCVVVTLSGPES
jgi:hypothetical protein